MAKSLYETLEVSENASADEIKKAIMILKRKEFKKNISFSEQSLFRKRN